MEMKSIWPQLNSNPQYYFIFLMFYASPVELKLRYIYSLIDYNVYHLDLVNFFALYCQVIYSYSALILHLTSRGCGYGYFCKEALISLWLFFREIKRKI